MVKHFHLIGIGGIGMSALAHLLIGRGYTVTGSDPFGSTIPDIKVFKEHHAENVGDAIVVYSTAIKSDNPERIAAKTLWHRSDLLQFLLQEEQGLIVTGTHGKTSTSSLLAHVLTHAGLDPSYVLGGHSPSLPANGHAGTGDFVVEGDESDGTFLKCPAFGAIITNLEADHLDYWGTLDKLKQAFKQFAESVAGPLIWCADDPILCELGLKGTPYRYGDIDFDFPLIGKHNKTNATAVYKLCLELGLKPETIQNAFNAFKGVKRRLEYRGEKNGVKFFDDYAHHPTEIEATLSAFKEVDHIVFQPHRYSRTKDLLHEFCTALSGKRNLILTDIYSAGESPNGITTQTLLDKLPQATYIPRDELGKRLLSLVKDGDSLLTMGAGDITKVFDEV